MAQLTGLVRAVTGIASGSSEGLAKMLALFGR
jgi:hypothetical protein